jgi:hypothetical protein
MVVVNNPDEDFQDDTIPLQDLEGHHLYLRLKYDELSDTGGARKISIYCPYVILNKSGLELNYKSRSMVFVNRRAAGQGERDYHFLLEKACVKFTSDGISIVQTKQFFKGRRT